MNAILALREAVVTMIATLATLACALALAPGPGPAVLAVVLCLSLARSGLDRDGRHRLESAVALPVVGLAAAGVGVLLRHAPWLGAAVFVVAMFASIWLRRYGSDAARIGRLLALPFVTLLVTPPIAVSPGWPVPAWFVAVAVALAALFWVSLAGALARRLRFLPALRTAPTVVRTGPTRDGTLQPDAPTRMAIQMAVALAASFAVGYAFFPQRWAWIVLTAFIVLSGNRGRLDVAYKSVLRFAGAAGGSALALAICARTPDSGAGTIALMLAAVFFGVWLRPLGYAWWALFVTIALALLQGFSAQPAATLLALRVEEIAIGALIGVACAWWILPLRSTDVLRRRLAGALAALGAALDPANEARSPGPFVAAAAAVEQLAPSFRASRFVTRTVRKLQPADWIDLLLGCRAPAIALIESGATPGDVRRAVGVARKALLEPSTLSAAMQELSAALAGRQPAR